MNHLLQLLCVLLLWTSVSGFAAFHSSKSTESFTSLKALKIGKNYEPKWKKKKTLAEESGSSDSPGKVGIVGSIPIVFKQGDETKKTFAIVGEPLSAVAAQAGQPIRYGCKKGECGTCEALCNGKWIRPCVAKVPQLAEGEELTLQLKAVKKTVSSGKFFSIRSFIMGFVNNLLGMVGFVKQRRAARKNWEERQEIEDKINQIAEMKRQAASAS